MVSGIGLMFRKLDEKVNLIAPVKKSFRLKYEKVERLHSKYKGGKWRSSEKAWIIEQKTIFGRWKRCSTVEFYNKKDALNHFKKHYMDYFIYN